MIALFSLILATQPTAVSVQAPDITASLIEFFRLSDQYRQCLVLDKSLAATPRDTYTAEGGTSAENLDLLLSDRQDRLLKNLIEKGKGTEIIDAIRRVRYTQVDEGQCRDFDPYYSPVLDKLEDLERVAGLEAANGQVRSRPQRHRQ